MAETQRQVILITGASSGMGKEMALARLRRECGPCSAVE
jgi:NAD(P)-dependent dehydrogenase (short-subunit alcohol dehydrogenase family)